MPPELIQLFSDLDLDRIRLVRPTKFVFLCGGFIAAPGTTRPECLRDYLFRIKRLGDRMDIVLAEAANQLYRDTEYRDLISFEEDVARIASVVLVISESPGSLAELGAFSSNPTIRHALRVVAQSQYETTESFIRYGPIERMIKDDRGFVGFYPWRTNRLGKLVASSAKPHAREIVRFIQDHLNRASSTFGWNSHPELRLFFVLYWIIHLALAISPTLLHECVERILPGTSATQIRNHLFCLKLAGWIDRTAYSGRDYWHALHAQDAFEYAFLAGVHDRDTVRRRIAVTTSFRRHEVVPRHVLTSAAAARRQPRR